MRRLPPFVLGGRALLSSLFAINLVLGVFNLLPVGPLDGNQIVTAVLPDRLQRVWLRLSPLIAGIVVGLSL